MTALSDVPTDTADGSDGGGPGPGFRLTARVFWDLAVYMVGFGLAVGVVFRPSPPHWACRASTPSACPSAPPA